jgi:type VI secretion system secreted protein VgrG
MSSFSFRCSVVPRSARVLCFTGTESISGLFSFDIHLIAPDDDCAELDLDAALGAKGTLTVEANDPRRITLPAEYHGVLSDLELVHAMEGRALIRVTLVPRLAALTHGHHSRMWTKKTIPEVLSDVFRANGLGGKDVEMRLAGEHPVEEHVTQYHESDYAFVSRWMEREGITFHFDHSDDVDRLVLVDHEAAREGCQPGPVRYHPVPGDDVSAAQAFNVFRDRASAQPAAVRLVDYDYARPKLDVSGLADVSPAVSEEVVTHGARFFTPSDGERLARLRADERRSEERVYTGSGPVVGARSGYTLALEDHGIGALNRRYLVTSARHEGSQRTSDGEIERLVGRPLREGYRVEITAVPADVPFRRRNTARWPRIEGFEHGVIDGPAESEYAQIDDQGRYVVKIFFDESSLGAGNATTRLRMMQPHGGNPEGFHFPLRKGTEVVIAFLGGDPDRPFIAGFVLDTARPSPVVASNHTQNVIQTGGLTRIEIEDQKGKQYVWTKTPPSSTYFFLGNPRKPASHNAELFTTGDCLFDIGDKQDIEVGGKLTETVAGPVDETYETSQTSTITGPQKTTVTNAVEERYGSTQTTTVNGLRKETFESGHLTMVGGLRDETYEVGLHTKVTGGVTEIYTGGLTRTVNGATSETVKGPLDVLATGHVTQTYPTSVKQTYGPVTATYASLNWTIGPTQINAPHWHATAPQHTTFKAISLTVGPTVTSTGDTSNSVTGVSLSAYGAYASLTGVSKSVTGVHTAVVGPSATLAGMSVTLGGVRVIVTGVKEHA